MFQNNFEKIKQQKENANNDLRNIYTHQNRKELICVI